MKKMLIAGLVVMTALTSCMTWRTTARETPAKRDARMAWWREARFGMMVHYGLYSGLAGTWEGKTVATNGGMEWIEQRVKADTDTYAAKALPLFKPAPDFAKQWAKLAKEAGCKYVVFTTKHHEGFGLFDSKAGDFNAGAKLHRDLVKEIVAACRAEGLRVGFYHSVIDWHHDQYCYQKSKQLPHPLKGQPYPNGERDHAKYVAYLHQQVNELVSNYGKVDILWWDYSAQDFQGQEAWRAFDLMNMVRSKQPGIIMNNRLFRCPEAGWKSMGTEGYTGSLDPKYGDFITPEQHIPATGMPGVDWETCMTLNTTWGYSAHDHAWKSDATLIHNLIDIASKGGNYLLNIGPKGDGSIPEESIQSFRAIGAWMKVNGEAIYGTTASPFEKLEWGRCTQKTLSDGNTRLYLHVFYWPTDGKLIVPGLANKPLRASLLSDSQQLEIAQQKNSVTIAVPAAAPDQIATVIAFDIKGAPRIVKPEPRAVETPAQHDARMKWWREARFGLFLHWGVYSVPAGEWQGKTNYAEWFLEQTKMPVSQYEQFAKQFNPMKFDAKAWVRMAKDAGMKYIVITSKHHDGFGMFRSDQTDWCIKSTPFQRDPLKELAEACQAAGIKLCFYHSIMDWHHPDWGLRRAWNDKATGEPDMDRYTLYMKSQLKELLTRYGPIGILWFDGEWEKPWTHERGVDLYDYIRGLQPQIIINNRVGKARAGMEGMDKGTERIGDYGTPEQTIPATGFGPGVDWESCMTMNNHWGYNKNDQNWKSAQTLVRNLIDCASKGGNYLLNIGPTAEGEFPPASVERLAEIGKWMKANSESIYGTTASPFEKLEWGRCTQQKLADGNTRLYLHVFDWPADGKLVLPGLANKPLRAWLLAGGQGLTVNADENSVAIALPAAAPDKIASVIALDIQGAPRIVKPDPYANETPAQRDARMKWWRAARFGMFIHWGVYSVPAGTWNGRQIPGIGEWIMNRAKIPCADYWQFAKQFNPVKFDANDWVKTAKDAGMKYIVITSKHHDGFAMFDSKASDWNIVKATPFGRDPLKELAAACRKQGLKLGFYYSQAQDWNNGGSAAGGKWDKAQERSMDDYIDRIAVPQVKEILTHYGEFPAVLWWDTPHDMNQERAAKLIALLKLKPGIIHNNRLGGGFKGDTETPEQFIPATGYPGCDWETCMTMNDTWGYKSYDHNWKSVETLIRNLCDIASKGGNYLLNVGPTSAGVFPQPIIERLKAIGQWMQVNGAAIYGTSASPFRKLPFGRCTKVVDAKGTTLNLLVFDWPKDGRLLVPGLKNPVEKAWLLAGRQKLETQTTADGVIVSVPAAAPDPVASVVVLRVCGEVVPPPLIVTPNEKGVVTLLAEEATLKGGLKTESYGHKTNIGFWTNPADTASWDVKAAGRFKITIEAGAPGVSQVTLQAGKHSAALKITPPTGDFKKFRKYELGTIELTGDQPRKVMLQAVKEKWHPVNVREIRLTPVK